ncbi:ATP-binding protein [Gramella sp. KN1008]|uniref:tetratricopeptide repeat-containing hybrid sensor histidine kinase/response regulator n=1 Tax=Gramella sp. KN1008 TaxID=2529298 RepID=UPI00103ED5BB|nr:ATP-binding protein [Gramella sp. KN1008]TBW28392.1 response regulator [Gramella sp. KN1008]
MKKNYFFFLPVFFLLWNFSISQEADSSSRDTLFALLARIERSIQAYDYEKAVEYSHSLISLAKNADDPYFVAKAYNQLGHVYVDLDDKARARRNYILGLEYAKKGENDTLIMHSYNYLGNIYSEIPETRQKGINYYNKGIELAEKINDPVEAVIPKANIGWTYLDNGEYDKAYPYISQSLATVDSAKSTYEKKERLDYIYSQLYMLHGRYYTNKRKYETAAYFFTNSIRLAEEDSLILPAAEAYYEYAEMLEQKGEFEEAYKAQEKYVEFNSKVFESEKLRQMEIANARFNLNEYRKDLEIAEKEQQYHEQIIEKSREKVIVMVLSSLGLIFILVFLHKVNRDRQGLISKLKIKNNQYKEAKDEAEKLSVLKTKFFSTVSHEIRTPLYGVIGLTSLLLEDKSLERHKGDLRSLKFSADYLLALINDVLQMNKMESNEVKLEHVSFQPKELMESIVNSFEFTRIQNKNKIHLEIDEAIPTHLIGDSVRLSQVLMNLVGNAMKFTERGHIHIQASQIENDGEHSKIYFEVKDDGPGIPESKKKVVFEEFSQLNNSNYSYQGTGLGLPIVKRLLTLFNSKIKLDSKEGEGSTFSFTIEFKIDHSKRKKSKIQPELLDTVGYNSSRNILIVDDNRINQVVTKKVLVKKDFSCTVAGDGHTAIALAKSEDFDLILMDVNMPGISGLEASREIRKFNKEIPILALTAVEVDEIREEIMAAGMTDIIVKPYDVKQFYQIVYKHLSLRNHPQKV